MFSKSNMLPTFQCHSSSSRSPASPAVPMRDLCNAICLPPPKLLNTGGGFPRGGGYWALVQGGLAGQEKYAPALRTSHTLCVSAILRDQSLARTGGAFFAKCRPSCLRCLQARSQHINTEGQGAGGQGAWYGESLIHLCTHSL